MTKLALKIGTLSGVGVLTFWLKHQFLTGSTSGVPQIVGGVLGLIAIVYLIMEKRLNLAYFYGRSQSAGSNANGSVIAGLAIGLIATSYLTLVISLISGLIILLIINTVIKEKQGSYQ